MTHPAGAAREGPQGHPCAEAGLQWLQDPFFLVQKTHRFIYYSDTGWAVGAEESDFEGWAFPFPGVTVIEDFVTREEEAEMVQLMDREPWKPSQSGRRKQVGGPRAGRTVAPLGPSRLLVRSLFAHLPLSALLLSHTPRPPGPSRGKPPDLRARWAGLLSGVPCQGGSKADSRSALSAPFSSWPGAGDCHGHGRVKDRGGFLEGYQVPSCLKFSPHHCRLLAPVLLIGPPHPALSLCRGSQLPPPSVPGLQRSSTPQGPRASHQAAFLFASPARRLSSPTSIPWPVTLSLPFVVLFALTHSPG